ncbi:MAG: hypothetical protein JSS66_04405 [Armatimonadetes bacterium]|nr:hypothetical protein [Armatimonadota bacterium]
MSATSEPFQRSLSVPEEAIAVTETEFEKPRGINRVEIRRGYCTAHVTGLQGEISEARVGVLKTIAEAGISIDFLKLTQGGLSFVAPEGMQEQVAQVLESAKVPFDIKGGRCIVLTFAANMRDEEGLIARVVSEVIGTGVEIDHLGDMHDRVLMVMDAGDGERVARHIEQRLVGAEA